MASPLQGITDDPQLLEITDRPPQSVPGMVQSSVPQPSTLQNPMQQLFADEQSARNKAETRLQTIAEKRQAANAALLEHYRKGADQGINPAAFLSMGQALMQPTKFGALSETLGNVSGALVPYADKQHQLSQHYADLLAQTEAQQAAGEYGETQKEIDKRFDNLTKLTSVQARIAAGQGGGRNLIKQGDVWLERDPTTGTFRPVAAGEGALLAQDFAKGREQALKYLDTTDPEVINAEALRYVEQMKARRAAGAPLAVQTPGSNVLTPVEVPRLSVPAQTGAGNPPPDMKVPPTEQKARDSDAVYIRQEELSRLMKTRDELPLGPDRDKINVDIATLRKEQLGGRPALKSAETEAEKAGRGGERGKINEKNFHTLMETGNAAQDLNGQLNVMKQLFTEHGGEIPSGKGAEWIAGAKSLLDTFGIDTKGKGPTDVIQGLGTMGALKSRTADGQNLLPGAMSNYEDQMLRSAFPGLNTTREGRLLQIEILQAQLRMKKELSDAAVKFYSENGKFDATKFYPVAQEIASRNPFLDPRKIRAMEAFAKVGAK